MYNYSTYGLYVIFAISYLDMYIAYYIGQNYDPVYTEDPDQVDVSGYVYYMLPPIFNRTL